MTYRELERPRVLERSEAVALVRHIVGTYIDEAACCDKAQQASTLVDVPAVAAIEPNDEDYCTPMSSLG